MNLLIYCFFTVILLRFPHAPGQQNQRDHRGP
jgi:hypothetical protein